MIEIPKALKPFGDFGIELRRMVGKNAVADCIFCGKIDGLSLSPEDGQWVCSSSSAKCGRSGNVVSFFQQWLDGCRAKTTDKQWESLSALRDGLPIVTFKKWGFAWDDLNGNWLWPCRTPNGTIQTLRRYRPGQRIHAVSGITTGLLGIERLAAAKRRSTVHILEGDWDTFAWDWTLRRTGNKETIVVGIPGGRGFRAEWWPYFATHHCVWLLDNDPDGRSGTAKGFKALTGTAASQKHLVWPEGTAEKYDVRDLVTERVLRVDGGSCRSVYSWVQKNLSDSPPENATVSGEAKAVVERPKTNPTFEETAQVFRDHFKMTPDLEEALQVVFAVVLSTQMSGSPLWMYLVGSPGSLKTELLLSLRKVPEVFYQSNVHTKALLSGFKQGAGAQDPSILPDMLNHCFVAKDWTEILDSHEQEQKAVYALLRGLYDGTLDRAFGNGIRRKYDGWFSMLAGVTNVIHAHSYSTTGERFLKFQLQSSGGQTTRDKMFSAMRGINKESAKSEALQEASLAFLDRNVPEEMKDFDRVIPDWAMQRIASLAQLIALLRHAVERDREGDLLYRPETDPGMRLSVQLAKLGMMLAVVRGERILSRETYRIVERVAFDTGIGFSLDVIQGMMELSGKAIVVSELADQVGLSRSSVTRRLEDLRHLKAVAHDGRGGVTAFGGRPAILWRVNSWVAKLWREAGVMGDYKRNPEETPFEAISAAPVV